MVKITLFTLAVLSFLVLVGSIDASGNCTPIYGGGITCKDNERISIDKKVLHPTQKTPQNGDVYVDTLSSTDPKFLPDQTVKFQLSVTNTGRNNIKEANIIDTFPSYVNFVKGPGSYNSSDRTLTIKVNELKSNETRRFEIEAKTSPFSLIPSSLQTACGLNLVSVKSGRNESADNSVICIERREIAKGGLPVMNPPQMKQTPNTGPGMLALFSLAPLALGGIFLRRRALS
jgi:uncharacterized repeat protein (TIGR01451 family)